MKRIAQFTLSATSGILLAFGTAFSAGLTHATGASAADVRAIKGSVTALRHGEPTAIDWYIAVDGRYAVAYDGCGPGACDENQLVRRGLSWIVTCYTTEGKGQFGACLTPSKTEQRLRRMALCMAMSSVDGIACTNAR